MPSTWSGFQGPIHLDLEHFQGQDIHNLSGQLVSVSNHTHSEEFLPNISSESILFQFETITHFPITTHPSDMSLPIFLVVKGFYKPSTPSGVFFSRG